jgi:hypothetical protein
MKHTESEQKHREALIEGIERYTGPLTSVPYHLIDTRDLDRLYLAIVSK